MVEVSDCKLLPFFYFRTFSNKLKTSYNYIDSLNLKFQNIVSEILGIKVWNNF